MREPETTARNLGHPAGSRLARTDSALVVPLWAVDNTGTFTFSSGASAALLGYETSELVGQPFSLVIDGDDLFSAREAVAEATNDAHGWTAATVSCRHRNGSPVPMEMSGKSHPSFDGRGLRFEGTSRLLPTPDAETQEAQRMKEWIGRIIDGGMILTAFQPIHDLTSGHMTGVEALARFPSDDGRSPEHWFIEAVCVGLGGELEFAARAAALGKNARLPGHLYVSFNVSPETCWIPGCPACCAARVWPLRVWCWNSPNGSPSMTTRCSWRPWSPCAGMVCG
ncbi:PAS domain-containing protein [Arthrobacter sp. UYCo732]|uniref:PAS domain-containing protein n=1 Tax=Arthrobacter sp. UYCo732 TaxID=3156336 RepID=UPI0033952F14